MIKLNQLLKGLLNPVTVLGVMLLIGLCYFYVDRPLVNWLVHFNLLKNFPVLMWITNLGNSSIDLVIIFVVALVFRYGYVEPLWEQRAWFLWLCVACSNLICGVLKVILGRARPDLWLQSHEFGFFWLKMDSLHMSFPSGHTTTIMSMAFGFSVLFPRFWYWFLSVGALVVLSRVLLLQHYLSDVLAAIYLTLLVVMSLVCVLRKQGWMTRVFEADKL